MCMLRQISELTDTLGKSATPIFKKFVHIAPVDADGYNKNNFIS